MGKSTERRKTEESLLFFSPLQMHPRRDRSITASSPKPMDLSCLFWLVLESDADQSTPKDLKMAATENT